MSDIRFLIKQYIDAGWSVVPLVKGEKRASSSWHKKTYSPADFQFDDGVAGKCGEPSGWRVDVDCDCIEAVKAAKRILPPTGLIHGRPGKPDRHYWYVCPGVKTVQFTDVKDSAGKTAMLVELRSTGGYTALPPSGHPSGDVLAWSIEREPADKVTAEELHEYVRDVAIAAFVVRHWGELTHESMGHLAGSLLHGGLSGIRILNIFETVGAIVPGNYTQEILSFARTTIDKHKAGDRVTGGPKLSDFLGELAVNKLRGWLKMADEDAIEEMNQKYFIGLLGKTEVIGREEPDIVIFQQPKDIALRFANRRVPCGMTKKGEPILKTLDKAWLESRARRSYEKIVFAPPPCPIAKDDYNLWKGFAIQPSDAPCDLYLQHLHEVICSDNTEHFDFLINVLAQTVQEPGTPSGVATVLRGQQGTGKGAFVRALELIFGRRHFTQVDKIEEILGGFNETLSGKVVVFADEALWGGGVRQSVGALKRLITEPTLHINPKHVAPYDETNHVHLFMATNEDWSWPAALDDRRGFLLKVSAKHRRNAAYFEALFEEMKNGGAGGLLKYLLDWPVDHKRLKQVPHTKERRHQQMLSLSPELTWWLECLVEGHIGQLGCR